MSLNDILLIISIMFLCLALFLISNQLGLLVFKVIRRNINKAFIKQFSVIIASSLIVIAIICYFYYPDIVSNVKLLHDNI